MEEKKEGAYIAPDVLLRMIVNEEDEYVSNIWEMMVMGKGKCSLVTSSFGLWEMMSCLNKEEIVNHADRIKTMFAKLEIVMDAPVSDEFAKFFPCVENADRIAHLRELAFKEDE